MEDNDTSDSAYQQRRQLSVCLHLQVQRPLNLQGLVVLLRPQIRHMALSSLRKRRYLIRTLNISNTEALSSAHCDSSSAACCNSCSAASHHRSYNAKAESYAN